MHTMYAYYKVCAVLVFALHSLLATFLDKVECLLVLDYMLLGRCVCLCCHFAGLSGECCYVVFCFILCFFFCLSGGMSSRRHRRTWAIRDFPKRKARVFQNGSSCQRPCSMGGRLCTNSLGHPPPPAQNARQPPMLPCFKAMHKLLGRDTFAAQIRAPVCGEQAEGLQDTRGAGCGSSNVGWGGGGGFLWGGGAWVGTEICFGVTEYEAESERMLVGVPRVGSRFRETTQKPSALEGFGSCKSAGKSDMSTGNENAKPQGHVL